MACAIGICSSAALTHISRSELDSKVQESGVEEIVDNQNFDLETAESKNEVNAVKEDNDNQNSDLETAEGGHFGPRVVVINKGYGGYGGYGGYHRSRGCGCGGGYGHRHYHSHHRYYGKKK